MLTKVTEPKFANFAITTKFRPKLDIIIEVGAGLRKVRDKPAVQIARSKVSEILRRVKPPQRNITQEREEALLKQLKDENIVIFKADEGNVTVYERNIKSIVC